VSRRLIKERLSCGAVSAEYIISEEAHQQTQTRREANPEAVAVAVAVGRGRGTLYERGAPISICRAGVRVRRETWYHGVAIHVWCLTIILL
jgi:hypothetical protein